MPLDLAKSFDCVVLFYKLNFIGVKGIYLFLIQSYMYNRIQTVQISNDIHVSIEIKFGVGLPQGSGWAYLINYTKGSDQFSL